MRLIAFLTGFLIPLIVGIAAPRVALNDGAKSSEIKTYVIEEAEPAGVGLTL
jgi:hypothetical protein